MALCLALIHHLRVSANIPVSYFIEWLRRLNATVIVEFIDRDDEMFVKLAENKREDYADYTSAQLPGRGGEAVHDRGQDELEGGEAGDAAAGAQTTGVGR